MAFGHNLHHMVPFGIPRVAFCMVVRRVSFVFSCPGPDFGGQDRIWSPPGRHFGPGTILGQFWGPKTYFCEEMILWWGYKGIPPAQMNSMVPGIHLGMLLCPKALLFKKIYVISDFPGKLQQGFPCCPDLLAIYPVFYGERRLALPVPRRDRFYATWGSMWPGGCCLGL